MIALIKAEIPNLTNIQQIGVGGQKWVYSVTHPNDGKCVLKIIHPREDFDRIDREILATNIINSDHVPKIFETGTVDTPMGPCRWIREEFVDGINLREYLLKNKTLPENLIIKMLIEILSVLLEAERVGVVHRDIKPENIMIDKANKFWLLDFGIARHLLLPSLTATGIPNRRCTPGYAPPEQFKGIRDDIDSRTDLFALGVTVVECATGVHPFWENANNETEAYTQTETKFIPPLKINHKNDSDFADLIASLVGKRRDQRPRNASEAFEWILDIDKD